MAPIIRIKTRWSGFTGAPGFTVMHFRDFSTGEAGDPTQATAQAAADRVFSFFNPLKAQLPSVVRLTIEPDAELLEETTGELLDVMSVTQSGTLNGAASTTAGYSAASGAVVNWRTNVVRNGRRIRGRTFLVPLTSTAYDTAGTLSSLAIPDIQAGINAITNTSGSPDLGVWARPSAPGAADGNWAVVSSGSVPDMAAVLRSRRD
jgi:hypothetical protein